MTSQVLSSLQEKKGLILGLLLIEIIIALVAIIIPSLLSLLILIPLLVIFYANPIWGLLCLIPFLPDYGISFYTIGRADITLLEVALLGACLCWVFMCIRENKIVFHGSSPDVAIFLIISWCAFSVFWSPSVSRGLYQILKMIPGLTIYYLHIHLVKNKREFNLVLISWIVMATVFSMVGLYETIFYGVKAAEKFLGAETITHLSRAVRTTAFFKSPDELGFILCLSIVLAFGMLVTTKSKKWKSFLWILLPFMFFVLLSTFSRKSFLGLIIALTYLSTQNKKALKSFLVISLTGLLLVFFFGSAGFLAALWHRLQSYFLSPKVSIKHRVQLWELALRLFSEHTIIGKGLGAFFIAANKEESHFLGPHSFYLFILSELGLIGLLLLLFWGIQIAQKFHQFYRFNKDKSAELMCKVMISGFLVIITQGFFRAMNLIDAIFWGFLGLSSAFLRIYTPKEI